MSVFEDNFKSEGMKVGRDGRKERMGAMPHHLFMFILVLTLPPYLPPSPQLILDNANVQHEIMEKLPLLAAFDGFKAITGRRLDDAGVSQGEGGREGGRGLVCLFLDV